ncbi:related to chitinase [Fusarium oxysporum]|uniref:chitinase n=1 Tax=Fusarium oxysporum TaxID=5507 RepID=A0A2H3T201_FUSOX|nr:related to chitinase [Fusarium oxysporum]
MRRLLEIFLHILVLGVIVAAADECSASKSCEIGCCSKYGFCGLGPNFCSTKVCVNNCERKAECDPGDFGKQYVNATKCPLNVNNQGFDRVVGYYEGWSATRPCNQFYPEQVPVGVYTHLNYAFASIDPVSFQVVPSLSTDVDMYKRVTNLKKGDPDLKVFIAIGGWTFNDPGPTATTFSDIARSQVNTEKFANSLRRFITRYNFDGVDLDWEYPGAEDRSGRAEDYKNFPIFLRRLKAILKSSSGRDGVSLTLPASYWYLQHFDINAIQKHIDFFNIMSYDLHGTWDKGNKWVGAYLNSHTNLTEITQALDLLWRNNLSSDKVVLGLAFYGRAFTVENTACTKPGCTYASGGKARSCSNEVSVILNSEIEDIFNSSSVKPTLYKKEAVKILNYEKNQWVAYDDEDTFKLKADFARGQCLGGLMVWAVSHDTKDAKYTAALAKAANRKFVAALPATDGSSTTIKTKHAQCKWTNCAENCPSGWLRVPRTDDQARKDEYMVDEGGCNGLGVHQFCCPPGEKVPQCGRYDFNNGGCGGKCPNSMVEIGSLSKYCDKSYEVACCSATGKSMQLYNQCSWSKDFPNCDKGTCSSGSVEIAKSMSGSGGAFCSPVGGAGGDPFSNKKKVGQERKYCCRDDLKDQKWSDCEWESHIGVIPKNWGGLGYCISGCPSDKVRVAMDYNSRECYNGGARAKCCTPSFSTTVTKNPEDKELADALDIFLDKPICTNETQSFRYESQEVVISRLTKMLYSSVSLDTAATWDTKVGGKYKNLKYKSIRDWSRSDDYAIRLGSTKLPESIVCQLDFYNKNIGSEDVLTCYQGKSVRPKSKRSLGLPLEALSYASMHGDTSSASPYGLFKRDQQYTITTISKLTGAQVILNVWGISYPSSGEFYATDSIWQRIYDFISTNCFDPAVGLIVRPPGNNNGLVKLTQLAAEHIFEKQGVLNFIRTTISGLLPDNRVSSFPGIDPSFWTTTAFHQLQNVAPIGGGELAPIRRIFTVLGADNYRDPFVLAGEKLNGVKATLWGYNDLADPTEMNTWVLSDPVSFLNQIRFVIGTIRYLNQDTVNRHLAGIITNLRAELALAEALYRSENPTAAIPNIVGRFDEWAYVHFRTISLNVQDFVFEWVRVVNSLQVLAAAADLIVISYFGHYVIIKLLLQKGAEIKVKDSRHGWTPLLWAAWNGHEAIIKLLLKTGADVESKDEDS